MNYFLICTAFLTMLAVIGIQAWVHVSQSRDWREERAFLLRGVMARSLPELQMSTFQAPTPPATSGLYDDLEGFEAQVGT